MIGRKFRSERNSSRTRVEYVFGKNHEHKCENSEFIGGNVFSTEIEDLINEMDLPTRMRLAATGKDSGLCHTHYMLSVVPGEILSDDAWRFVMNFVMERLGYTKDHKYFGNIHNDTEAHHLHILGNRTSIDTHMLLSDSNDYEILMQACRDLELKFGLKVVPMPHETWGTELEQHEITKMEKDRNEGRTPEMPWRIALLLRVEDAIERTKFEYGSIIDLTKHLKKNGVNVQFTKATDGNIKGISYEFRGKTISGRKLKKARCTFQKLTDPAYEGIRYDQSMLQELQKISTEKEGKSPEKIKHEKLKNRRSGNRSLPEGIELTTFDSLHSTQKHSLSSKESWAQKQRFFAIHVEADRFRRSLVQSLIKPTRVENGVSIYVFKKTYREVKNEIDTKNMLALMNAIIDLLKTVFRSIECKISLIEEYELCRDDVSVYQEKETVRDRKEQQKINELYMGMNF